MTVAAWHDLDVGVPAPEPVAVSSLRGRGDPDLVVVGMGASGLSAAVAAATAGADVVVLDAVGVAAGAAGANAGFLLAGLARFHHDAVAALGRAVAVAWYRRTLEELDRVAAEEPTFRRVGSLRTAADRTEAEDLTAHLAALRADGLPGEEAQGPDGSPALLVPGDGAVHPVARCRRLAAAAIAAGATLVAPARVTAVAPGRLQVSGFGSTGEEHPLAARRVLVAVDGGLEHVVAELDVRSARLQMLATEPTDEVGIPGPVYHRWGLDYVQQLPTGEVLLGGGRDVGGEAEWGPWDAPPGPSAAVQHHLDGWLADLGIAASVTHRWAARAAFTPDRMPVDRRVADGVHVVGGYSGHGNVLGPLLAREAATALLDG